MPSERLARERLKTRSNLDDAVASNLWPTPCARDHRSGRFVDPEKDRSPGKQGGAGLAEAVSREEHATGTGRLNPEWVEWLMGFPPGWTDCEPSETP
jgi:hypothetical protein